MDRVRSFYDKSADSLERKKTRCDLDAEETASILTSVGDRSRAILDVGCGTGHLLELCGSGFKLGLDLSIGMLELARRRGCDFPLVVADARRLPIRDTSFEVVVCQDVIGHLDDPRTVVAEMKRVCTDRGLMILTASRRRWNSSLTSLYSRIFFGFPLRSYRLDELEKIFEFSGADVIETEVIGGSMLKVMGTPKASDP